MIACLEYFSTYIVLLPFESPTTHIGCSGLKAKCVNFVFFFCTTIWNFQIYSYVLFFLFFETCSQRGAYLLILRSKIKTLPSAVAAPKLVELNIDQEMSPTEAWRSKVKSGTLLDFLGITFIFFMAWILFFLSLNSGLRPHFDSPIIWGGNKNIPMKRIPAHRTYRHLVSVHRSQILKKKFNRWAKIRNEIRIRSEYRLLILPEKSKTYCTYKFFLPLCLPKTCNYLLGEIPDKFRMLSGVHFDHQILSQEFCRIRPKYFSIPFHFSRHPKASLLRQRIPIQY